MNCLHGTACFQKRGEKNYTVNKKNPALLLKGKRLDGMIHVHVEAEKNTKNAVGQMYKHPEG